jgi:hypothetical protein
MCMYSTGEVTEGVCIYSKGEVGGHRGCFYILQVRLEVIEDVYTARKKQHQTMMHYFSSLNALQYKKKISLLEPLLGYMQAQVPHVGPIYNTNIPYEVCITRNVCLCLCLCRAVFLN